ncbi:hypothetical protein Dimus_016547 [Dionaea muscipula]
MKNHAVRRAHMQTRVLETFYLSSEDKGGSGLWAWIMNKLGMEKDVVRSDEFDSDSLMFPWHLLKSDDDLLVMNRSFDTLWTLDFNQGVVKDVVKGPSLIFVVASISLVGCNIIVNLYTGSKNIVELCGRKIADHVSLLHRLPHDLVEEMVNSTLSLDGIPYSGLLSSFVTSGNRLLICDAASHRVMIFTNEGFSNLHLTNFGVLGLPYWLPSSPEKVYGLNVHGAGYADHLQSLKLLPGTINTLRSCMIEVLACGIVQYIPHANTILCLVKNKGGGYGIRRDNNPAKTEDKEYRLPPFTPYPIDSLALLLLHRFVGRPSPPSILWS